MGMKTIIEVLRHSRTEKDGRNNPITKKCCVRFL